MRGRQILYGGYTDDVVHLVTRPAAGATTHETLDVSKDCSRPTAPKFADADSDQVVTNCKGNERILVTKKGDLSGGS